MEAEEEEEGVMTDMTGAMVVAAEEAGVQAAVCWSVLSASKFLRSSCRVLPIFWPHMCTQVVLDSGMMTTVVVEVEVEGMGTGMTDMMTETGAMTEAMMTEAMIAMTITAVVRP